VRVDIVDLARFDPCIIEGDGRGPRSLAPVGSRLDHVMGIGRRAVAEELGVGRGPPPFRDLGILEHDERGTFAHDEPVALGVERPGGVGRIIVVTTRQRADDVECAERQRRQGDLAAAGDRRVDPAGTQVAERLADPHRAGGARVGRRQDRAADIERDAEIGRRRTAEDGQRQGRGDLPDALLDVALVLLLGERDAAERRAEVDADALGRRSAVRPGAKPGIVERESSRHHPELAESVELPRRLRRHERERVEVVDLRSDLASEGRWVEAIDPLDRRRRPAEPVPERVHARADRRDQAETGDPDAPLIAHAVRFGGGAGSDLSIRARASASALKVPSVRPAMGRVKRRSTNAAKPGTRGENSWLIVMRQPPEAGRVTICHVTSIPRVAPATCWKRNRSVSGSDHVRDRQATGSPRPRTGTSGRRAMNSTSGRPQASWSMARERT